MRVPRVFVQALRAGEVALSGGEAQHLAQVLRLAPGASVRAFDGAGLEAAGVVTEVNPVRVMIRLQSPQASEVEASLKVTLAVALLKGDKLAEVVRRGTELGVVRFTPFTSRRCEVRELSPNKQARLLRVAQEAAKQSGRSVVPEVAAPVPLGELAFSGVAVVAQPNTASTLRETLLHKNLAQGQLNAVTAVTGPEGGLTDDEVGELIARGATSVRLGARILRAETAPVAVAAALLIPEAL